MNRSRAGSAILLVAAASAIGQPVITQQPEDTSSSLGGNPRFQVRATGVAPLSYQWEFNGTAIVGATNSLYAVSDARFPSGGAYRVTVRDSTGETNSRSAMLDIDGTFTKVQAGGLARNDATSFGMAWGDYDGDGWLDVALRFLGFPIALYRNNGNGTFTQKGSLPLAQNTGNPEGIAWADYDNDGDLDLYAANDPAPPRFYRNEGEGTFSAQGRTVGSVTGFNGTEPETSSWADYDGDGFLDVFVADAMGGQFLHHNDGNGKFTLATAADAGSIASDKNFGRSASWFDFDHDGDLDLFVVTDAEQAVNVLYRNDGGKFTRLSQADAGSWISLRGGYTQASVADYDNDGFLDLLVAQYGTNKPNRLFHNEGNGTFLLVTNGVLATDAAYSGGSGWADYDNDGWLDLCVANIGVFGSGKGQNNFLYHNNGNGTFTRIFSGSISNDGGSSFAPAWVDYDNDGFMDLYITNGAGGPAEKNFLYHNNGSTNHWLKLRLTGTASNRSAIGAVIRVKATVAGRTFWQMRQVSVGDGLLSPQEPRPHFGLGNAMVAEIVRIEWPSGEVQELRNVRADQILPVTEPLRLTPSVRIAAGKIELQVRAWPGQRVSIEGSDNLNQWKPITTLTNLDGHLSFSDADAPSAMRFYRANPPATDSN